MLSLFSKILRLPLCLIPPGIKVPILQGKIRGKKWIVGSSSHGCWLGNLEYKTRRLFEKKITSGSIVYDIGANVGLYTLLASVLTGPGGKVIAFEPVPGNLFYLYKHLEINSVHNAQVIEAAVSDYCGEGSFSLDFSDRSYCKFSTEGKLKVKVVTLDDLITRRVIPAPQYIKIDVEGAEFSVLSGARFCLKDHHPQIFLALHGDDNIKKCYQFLRALDYKVEEIEQYEVYAH